MLHFKHPSFGYDSTLFQIDEMSLETGRLYTLAGRNGIGKTTFFQSLLGLVPLRDGSISLDSISLETIKSKDKATLIAFVSSKFDGVQHLNGWEYVALGRTPYTNFTGKLYDEDKQIIEQQFEELGIEHLKHKDSSKMSDGERQILSIARALVQQTKVILLDEPSAFLDYPNRVKVLQILKEVAQKKQICIIQSSHDIELAHQHTGDFLIIKNQQMNYLDGSKMNTKELLEKIF